MVSTSLSAIELPLNAALAEDQQRAAAQTCAGLFARNLTFTRQIQVGGVNELEFWFWSGRPDLNRRPPAPKRGALPIWPPLISGVPSDFAKPLLRSACFRRSKSGPRSRNPGCP